MDMSGLREVSGSPVEGILGMDFLGRQVVHIDFDQGLLLFLKSAPKTTGGRVQILWEPGGSPPLVEAELGASESVRFAVDTGYISLHSGILRSPVKEATLRKGELAEIGSVLSENISGTTSSRLYRGRHLRLGEFAVEFPIFGGSLRTNALGNRFWSRFVVTFDFPSRIAYLRKGDGYNRPDLRNATGLHLGSNGGFVVVHSVDPGSPATRAGLQAGDAVLRINGLRSGKASLFELREALCGNRPVECVVGRTGNELRLVMIPTDGGKNHSP